MCETPRVRSFVVVAVALLAPCCVDPRPARRADALDVAGVYAGVVDDSALLIDNEADKNDVRLTLTRAAASTAEAPLLARLDGGDDDVALVLELGRGPDDLRTDVDGGENVSFDGGLTSTVSVSGPDVPALPGPGARDAALRWSMQLVADVDGGLVGALRLSGIERRPRAGEGDGATTESEHVDVDVAFVRQP